MSKKKLDQADVQNQLLQLLLVTWRRWGILCVVLGLLISVAGSALAYSMFEPKCEAKLFFRIIQNLEWIELAKGLGDEQDPKNVLSMMESDIIASRVIAEPEIVNSAELKTKSVPVAALKDMVNVRSEGGRELYAINAQSHVPTVAAKIAHSYWQKFLSLIHI